jgi:stage IV sporulation protein B
MIYSAIFVGEKTIPDNITVIENEDINISSVLGMNLYSLGYENQFDAVMKTSNVPQKATKVKFLNIIPVKDTVIKNAKRQYVIPGGELFGIKLYTDGVIIVDFEEIETETGKICPAKIANLKVGDIVKSVNKINVTSSSHFSKLLQESKGEKMQISVLRNEKIINVTFETILEKDSGKYRAGLWVRDSTAGLGTVTFYNKISNTFAGLGHPIYDIDTNEIMPMKSGVMAEVTLSGLNKSSFGKVGELCGILTGGENGVLFLNDVTGIYGYSVSDKTTQIPVAVRTEIKEGKADIICTVNDSGPQIYEVEITKIYSNSLSVNKDMVIKVTDDNLLNITGGIVQGMSGSPIIQNGMLVGAVTHVFVNNPKQGYAIFAERMLETSNKQVKLNTDRPKSVS